jgi:4-amino-4-deoxy-L-arabinose transferase-like glycosyltransferase
MGRHLDLWRMDFPPLIALIAETVRATLGDSLVALRLVPALAGTGLVVLAALIAREMGGGRRAQLLAGLAVFANALFMRPANLFQPVVLDQLWWTVGLLALAQLARDGFPGQPQRWMLLAVAAGLGLLTKFSIVFFGFAACGALVLTPWRRALVTPWPWLSLLGALVIGSPSLVGQWRLDWPVIAQMTDLRTSQLTHVAIADFLGFQVMLGPGTLLALAGLVALLAAPMLVRFRIVGLTCLIAFLTLLGLRGKPYYVGPIYPALFAAGAVLLERVRPRRVATAAQWAAAALLLGFGLAVLPLGLPVLSPPRMAEYAAHVAGRRAVTTNRGDTERLPQDYADMLGWEDQVAAVARVYDSLPAADRGRAVLLASNYGEAGALDFFGPRYGLPPAVTPVGSYWFFGPGDLPGDVAIAIGFDPADLNDHYASITTVAHVTHPYAVAEERNLTILVCRAPRTTLQAVWPSLRGMN